MFCTRQLVLRQRANDADGGLGPHHHTVLLASCRHLHPVAQLAVRQGHLFIVDDHVVQAGTATADQAAGLGVTGGEARDDEQAQRRHGGRLG